MPRPRRRAREDAFESAHKQAYQPSAARTHSDAACINMQNTREFNRLKHRGNERNFSIIRHRFNSMKQHFYLLIRSPLGGLEKNRPSVCFLCDLNASDVSLAEVSRAVTL